MKLYDAPRGTPYALRIFILERRGLTMDVEVVDTPNMAQRRAPYINLNPRGTVPALQLDDGKTVLTEFHAVAEYLDEIAQGDFPSLYGATPEERAETRMWVRRMDYEICQPVIDWWRDDPASIDKFLGHRIPCPEARLTTKLRVNRALNQLDDDLEDKTWICGSRFTAADMLSYGLLRRVITAGDAEWVLHPARHNFIGWWNRMEERPASKQALEVFQPGKITV